MLGIKDLLLTPVYLFTIYIIAFIYRSKFVKNKEDKKYFIYGLTLKLIGAIFLGLIYQFYYNGGDTANYFNDISVIYNSFFKDPSIALKLITYNNTEYKPELYPYLSNMIFAKDAPSYFVVRLGAILALFSFGTYTIISLGFAILSFISIWLFYTASTKLFPDLKKEFAISIFFIPSIFFWGSGLMKDSITFGAVAITFFAFHRFFLEKKKKITDIFLLVIGIYILKTVKIYIALCLIPSLMLYLYVVYYNRITSRALRILIKPLLLIMLTGLSYYTIAELSKENSLYRLDKLAETARTTAGWINYVSEQQGGSSYSLGNYDATLSGILMKAPEAIWVTLFRPYIWESKNIIMLLSAFESFFFLFLTLKAIYKLGFVRLYKEIKSIPYVQFSLLFSLSFSFAVGISTYNFGSLVRYKIPMMPFYLSSIYVLSNTPQKTKLSFRRKKGVNTLK
ncbi:hypothetical protein MYP_1019 [Sporocytophaga myxococcoides]|uniref:Glycosyltransferase RgtA/B/C/D-like domain-containing protein n=1 Tax=Sporocytophaga myxococcoides TaxID=153721 RepID=A0A098LA57_9BACT|nr:hypothetical protein [Sporocytophaga myxococcoides]GAL83791.1 hypothetical protein MYP_1019 [Sporocytophaga myxococcoides]